MSLQIEQLLSKTTSALKDEGIESARLDALLIFEYVLGHDRTHILVHQEETVSMDQVRLIGELTDRRLGHEPIAYITGYREFYGLPISVTKDVLIPRPETEAIVQYLESCDAQAGDCLDLGTGSGALAIAIALHSDHQVVASDISEAALKVARNNADTLGADVAFVESDMFHNLKGAFDIIVANLPYVPTGMQLDKDTSFEPEMALLSGTDGLDHYRRLFKEMRHHLHDNGLLLIEHLPEQLETLTKIANRFRPTEIAPHVTLFTRP